MPLAFTQEDFLVHNSDKRATNNDFMIFEVFRFETFLWNRVHTGPPEKSKNLLSNQQCLGFYKWLLYTNPLFKILCFQNFRIWEFARPNNSSNRKLI